MIFLHNHSLWTITFPTSIFPYIYYLWHPLTLLHRHWMVQKLAATSTSSWINANEAKKETRPAVSLKQISFSFCGPCSPWSAGTICRQRTKWRGGLELVLLKGQKLHLQLFLTSGKVVVGTPAWFREENPKQQDSHKCPGETLTEHNANLVKYSSVTLTMTNTSQPFDQNQL